MASILDIVDLIHPANEEVGVILGDQAWVLFDREMDESSVTNGTFFLEARAQDIHTGPGITLGYVQPLGLNNDEDIFLTGGYKSIVQGTLTFERINLADLNEFTGVDEIGDGTLYRTKALFTPNQILLADSDYNVYLAGDEDLGDSLLTGVKSRSVFDAVTDVGNTGDGVLSFRGTYTDSFSTDTYRIEITTAGETDTALYTWYRDSAPLDIHPGVRTNDKYQELSYGVSVVFGTGTFDVGDQFSVVVTTPETFEDNFLWTFSTGSGSLVTVPSSTATSIIGDPFPVVASPVVGSDDFQVLSITPANGDVQTSTDLEEIVVTFNNPIEDTVLTEDMVLLEAKPVNGDPALVSPRVLEKDLTVDGSTLRIRIR